MCYWGVIWDATKVFGFIVLVSALALGLVYGAGYFTNWICHASWRIRFIGVLIVIYIVFVFMVVSLGGIT